MSQQDKLVLLEHDSYHLITPGDLLPASFYLSSVSGMVYMDTMLGEPSFGKACSEASDPSLGWTSQTVVVGL